MSGERFYLYPAPSPHPSTVVRERELDGTTEISVFDVELRRWVVAPSFLDRISGIGGDGLDRISREDASAILAKLAPAEAPR